MGGGGSPTLNQAHFRFANNDNATIGSTSFIDAEDTAIELALDTPVIVWVAIGNSGTKAASSISFELNANVDGGGAQRVGAATSNGIRSVNGLPADDASITANRLTAPQTTFVAGRYDEVGGDQPMSNITLDADQYTNVAFCFQASSAVLSGGESVTLTVTYDTGSALDNYTQTITFTTKVTLRAAVAIAFGQTADLNGTGELKASSAVAFTASATPVTPTLLEEQQTGEATASTTVTTSAAITAEAGKTYVVFIAARLLPTITSLTDSTTGLTWTLRDTQGGGRGQQTLYCYTSEGTPAADFTVTATFSASVGGLAIWIGKFAEGGIGSIDSYNTNGQNGATSGGTDSDMGSDESYSHTTTEAGSRLLYGSSHRVESAIPESAFEEYADFHGGPATGDQQGLSAGGKICGAAGGQTVYNTYSGAVDWSMISIELIAVDTGGIAASTAIAFGQTADLNGTGELAASEAIAVTQTAAIRGRAPIVAAESVQFGETAALSGLGELTAAEAIAVAHTATLSGAGELQAAEAIAFTQVALLAATGELSAAAEIAVTVTADLSGALTMEAATSVDFGQTALLSGTGELAAAEAIAFGQTAALSATAEMAGTAVVAIVATGTMLSDGQLLASAVAAAFGQTAAIRGRASIAAAESVDFAQIASLAGTGELSAAAAAAFAETATLSATGELAGAASVEFVAIGSMVEGRIQGSATIALAATATASGTGELAATAGVAVEAAGTMASTAAAAGTAEIAFGQTAVLRGRAAIAASATIAITAAGELTPFGRLVAAGNIVVAQTGVLRGDGALSANAAVLFAHIAQITGIGQGVIRKSLQIDGLQASRAIAGTQPAGDIDGLDAGREIDGSV